MIQYPATPSPPNVLSGDSEPLQCADVGAPLGDFDDVIIKRVLTGMKRAHDDPARKPKLPITVDVLASLVNSLDLSTARGLMLRAVFCGFLRCGEFTIRAAKDFVYGFNLTRNRVTFSPSVDDATHIMIDLPAIKTHPFLTGVRISPVSRAHLRVLFPLPPPPHALLFHGSDINTPLTRAEFISGLKDCWYRPSNYSGHSFRRGAATTAFFVGHSDIEVQQLGRWKSDAYALYIGIPLAHTPRNPTWRPSEPSPA